MTDECLEEKISDQMQSLITAIISQRLNNKYNFHKYGVHLIDTYLAAKKQLKLNYWTIVEEYNFVAEILFSTQAEWLNYVTFQKLFPNLQALEIKNINLRESTLITILSHLTHNVHSNINGRAILQKIKMKLNQYVSTSMINKYESRFKNINYHLGQYKNVVYVQLKNNGTTTNAIKGYIMKLAQSLMKNKKQQMKKCGNIFYQTMHFTRTQLQCIDSQFQGDLNTAPKLLFSDNYKDKTRTYNSKRIQYTGQSIVMGHWDKIYAFGIPTSFNNGLHDQLHKRIVFVSLYGLCRFWKRIPLELLRTCLLVLPMKEIWIKTPQKYSKELQASLVTVDDMHNRESIIKFLQYKSSQDFVFCMLDEYESNNQHPLIAPFWLHFSNKLETLFDPITSKNYQPLCLNTKWWSNLSNDKYKYVATSSALLIELYFAKMKFRSIQEIIYQSNPMSLKPIIGLDSGYTWIRTSNDGLLQSHLHHEQKGDWHISDAYNPYGQNDDVYMCHDQQQLQTVVRNINRHPLEILKYLSSFDDKFKQAINTEFAKLQTHLMNGNDVVIPSPTDIDLRKTKCRYFANNNGKQMIFHNIGTTDSFLSFHHLLFIQQCIDDLIKYAHEVKTVPRVLYDKEFSTTIKETYTISSAYPSRNEGGKCKQIRS
eukprot:119966_1